MSKLDLDRRRRRWARPWLLVLLAIPSCSKASHSATSTNSPGAAAQHAAEATTAEPASAPCEVTVAKTHIEGETERSVEAYMADADAKYTPVSRVAGTWSEFDPTTPNPIAPPLVQPADADTVAEDEGISFVFDADGRPIAATMVSAIDMGKSGTDLWRWVYRYDCTAASADAPSIDDVLALVEASSLQLDVTPAATLAEHYAKSVPSDAEPTLECSPDGGGWSCALYGGSDLGFFYSIALRPGEDGWVIAAEGTEVLPDD